MIYNIIATVWLGILILFLCSIIIEVLRLQGLFLKPYRKYQNYLLRHKKPKTKMRKRVVELSSHKEGLENCVTIKVVPEIEDYFRKASLKDSSSGDNTEVSSKWTDKVGEGLQFYKKNEKLSGKVSQFGPVMDNFGNSLMDTQGRINLAVLRIVGISEGSGVTIKTDDLLGYEETLLFIEQLAGWAKKFYEEHLRDQDLTGSITFEV